MFEKIKNIWNRYGFEIVLIGSILLIFIGSFFTKRGTWSKSFYSLPDPTPKPKKSTDSKGEIICRNYLEKFFNRPFKKARPDILRNPVTDNFNLELDCYNPELNLAVEYNGVQHYKYTPFFHKTRDAFHNQKYRDYLKRDLCSKNGIKLIEVPYTVEKTEIEKYLKEKLVTMGYLS
jgi:hypothetical protein